jgi:hypothetical protein
MMTNRVVIRTADEAAFFSAAKEAARRADRGEPFDGTITLSFEDPRRTRVSRTVARRDPEKGKAHDAPFR